MWLSSDNKESSSFIYFDGETAQPHLVQIKIENCNLQLWKDENHLQTLLAEKLSAISLKRYKDDPLTFSISDKEEARLMIPAAALPVLFRHFPALDPNGAIAKRKSHRKILKWAGLIVGFIFVLLLVLGPGIGMVAYLIPRQWEHQVGDDLLIKFIKEGKECGQAEGKAALKILKERLWPDADNPPPEVSIVSSPIVNAVALPGNEILIFDGLLEETLKSSELAGVLAHEMAHIEKRHPLQIWLRSTIITDIAALFGMSTLIEFLALNHYSSEMEAEADDGAYRRLEEAGINKKGLADFFRRLEEKDGSVLEKIPFLSSHPPLADRAKKADENQDYKGGEALSIKDWMALKKICEK